MGLSYSCVVFPAKGHVGYSPTAEEFGRVIEALVRAGWLEDNARSRLLYQTAGKEPKPLKVKSLSQSDVTSTATKASGSYVLELHNQRDQGDPTPFEEDSSGFFRPAYCEDAYVGVSQVPLLIEDQGYSKDRVACPSCKENAVLYRGHHRKVSSPSLLMGGMCFLPEKCPGCSAPLDPEKLSMQLLTAIDRSTPARERAPFFHFSLWLHAVESRIPEVERIKLDPALPALLKKACGVPFRSFGKLDWL